MCSLPLERARLVKARKLASAAARLERRAHGKIDVAIVLGSGLAEGVTSRISGSEISYDRLHAPAVAVAGHPGIAHVGTWAGKRVVAFAGRAHLYAGYRASDVTYLIRLAAAAGARIVVLTNAAGGLNPTYAGGDVMVIADHINLTGASPVDGSTRDPFLDMVDAYAPRLRELAHRAAPNTREGVYAGVRGPQYETPAEAEAIRRLGADAVGMSTVLETIAARALGLEVLGLSLITNCLGSGKPVSHADVLAAGAAGAHEMATLIERVVGTV